MSESTSAATIHEFPVSDSRSLLDEILHEGAPPEGSKPTPDCARHRCAIRQPRCTHLSEVALDQVCVTIRRSTCTRRGRHAQSPETEATR